MNLYGVTSSINKFRIGGLASGLDTDQMVSDLMKVERIPLDKLTQKKQLAEWKRDDYRKITNLLRGIKDQFFNILKPDSYALSRNYFKKVQAVSSDNTVITATAGVDAVSGNHTITVNSIATASSITSTDSVTKQIEGKKLDSISIDSVKGKSITFQVDGVSRTITVSSSINSAADLVKDLQSSIDAAFGTGKVIVGDSAGDGTGNLTFLPQSGSGISKLSVYSGPAETSDAFSILGFTAGSNLSNRINTGDTLETISGKLTKSFTFDNNGKLNLTINGKEFSFDKGTTLSSMMNTINSDSTANVNMQYNEITDAFTFTAKLTGAGNNLKINEKDSTFLASMGLSNITGSDSAQYNLTKTKMSINIDGVTKEIALSTGLTGYDQLTADIKARIEEAFDGITVDVSANADHKLTIALSQGSGSTLSIGEPADSAASALSELGLKAGYVGGKDASITLDGQNIIRSSNTFTVSGITYTALKISPPNTNGAPGERISQTISASLDTNNIYDNIKKFVEKYNEVITAINSKISEKYDRSYQPLTSDQKKGMSEDEIKQWDDKAKTGLLRNDGILQGIVYNMRRALSDKIDNVSINLSSIGITTGSYDEKGILKIDEAKLKAAIANNPEEVANLFTKKSDIDLDPEMKPEKRIERYNGEGLAFRLFDIIEDNIRTVNGKGLLLTTAGIEGDRTEFDSILYKQIDDYNKEMSNMSQRLYDKETRYYKKFAAMEKALSQMNQQSSWITSQFSQNN